MEFGSFDLKEMHDALACSKVYTGVKDLAIVRWIDRMKNSLPIWYPDGYLVRCSKWRPVLAHLDRIFPNPC